MRGKYAARAANRIAADKDAELHRAQAEIASLRAELAAALAELERERRDRGRLIVEHGNAHARDLVDAARRDALQLKAKTAEDNRRIAELAAEHFIEKDRIPRWWMHEVLPALIPDPGERTLHITEHLLPDYPLTRDARRHAARNIRVNDKTSEEPEVRAMAIERARSHKQSDEQET